MEANTARVITQHVTQEEPRRPGALLALVLEDNSITPQEIERRTGVPAAQMEDVLYGQGSITSDIVRALQYTRGTDGRVWWRLQARYDAFMARRGQLWALDAPPAKDLSAYVDMEPGQRTDAPDPAGVLARVLRDHGLVAHDVAQRGHVAATEVDAVLAGTKPISAQMAVALERATGIGCESWVDLQTEHDFARLEVELLGTVTREELALLGSVADVVSALMAEGYCPKDASDAEQVLWLRRALRVENLVCLGNIARDGLPGLWLDEDRSGQPAAVGAWICLCVADWRWRQRQPRVAWDLVRSDSLISDLKRQMMGDEWYPEVDIPAALARYGISGKLLLGYRQAGVMGCARRGPNGTCQMGISLLEGCSDVFWFGLLHEIGHIALGHVDQEPPANEASRMAKEWEADRFAWDALLDPDEYGAFAAWGDFSIAAIERHAREQGILTGIVISRLQKDGLLGPNEMDEYKETFAW